jgi:4-carboxymuconolactone decarboxylase
MKTRNDNLAVTPALDDYTERVVQGELWARPDLNPRDRSIVTFAALIAKNQSVDMPYYLNRALDSGVSAAEVSEMITHLAFYSGWANAQSAAAATKSVFAQRGITPAQLPPAAVQHLPLDPVAEGVRAASVEKSFGAVSPGLVSYTGQLLFQDLWLRPALAPRDRSLITVSALIATGQTAQITFHLNKAMDSGLTQRQAAEVLTQLAFISGWPTAFSAAPVFKEVFGTRAPLATGAQR